MKVLTLTARQTCAFPANPKVQADEIPKPMRDRLPSSYLQRFLARGIALSGGELHKTVLKLVRAYHFNYDMVFPGLNTPALLYQYSRELGLPGAVSPMNPNKPCVG